jgi:hypothetical protein
VDSPEIRVLLAGERARSVFRAKFIDGLRQAFRKGKLVFSGSIAQLANPKRFAAFVRSPFKQRWVLYAKPAFGAPTLVLRYLGRYTHRVAISNHRLLAFDGERVTFRWKDYAHGNKQKKMTLEATEFLRRFTQHILPRGFVRIRQFGFLTNNRRSTLLALARKLLDTTPKPVEACPTAAAKDSTWQCAHCNGEMRVGPNLSARQLASR